MGLGWARRYVIVLDLHAYIYYPLGIAMSAEKIRKKKKQQQREHVQGATPGTRAHPDGN